MSGTGQDDDRRILCFSSIHFSNTSTSFSGYKQFTLFFVDFCDRFVKISMFACFGEESRAKMDCGNLLIGPSDLEMMKTNVMIWQRCSNGIVMA